MKHFVIVLSIILFVSLTFLHPSIIEDASFNDYAYLQQLRRTHNTKNDDNKDKGWQDNGTFNTWYQKGNGAEKDKYLNDLKSPNTTSPNKTQVATHSKTVTSQGTVPISTPHTVTPKDSSTGETSKSETNVNLLPFLLLLLILLVVIIVYTKYKMENS